MDQSEVHPSILQFYIYPQTHKILEKLISEAGGFKHFRKDRDLAVN